MSIERGCEDCTLCCKVLGVEELDKPAGRWCRHCDVGKGCTIYEQRPQECRDFRCLFLAVETFPEEWRPNRAHFVLTTDADARRVLLRVDPDRPNAWRFEPYYSYLKRWSAKRLAEDLEPVVVHDLRSITVILPDRDVPLGRPHDDQDLQIEKRMGPAGIRYEARIVSKQEMPTSRRT